MADYITTRQYADMHGIPLETVRNRTKHNQIPFIKVGNSIMIKRDEPWLERKKTGRIPNAVKEAAVDSRQSKVKIKITRAYHVAVVDSSGKEIKSDFTFLTKADAEAIGKRMKKEIEDNNGNR